MVARSCQTFPPPPLIIPYGGFSPVRLEARLVTLFSSAAMAAFETRPAVLPFLAFLIQASWNRGYAHRPLAQHGLSYPRLQTLLRPDSPVLRTPSSLVLRLTLSGLCPFGRFASPSLLCFDLLYQHATTSTPSADQVPVMVHPLAIGAFTHDALVRLIRNALLTGFREGIFSRRQFSRYVAACWLARAADQSPPTASPPTGPPVYGRACLSQVSLN
jgi:hypothetical protein